MTNKCQKVKKKLKGLITVTNKSNFVNCQLTSLEVTPFKSYKQGTNISCVAIYHHKERNEQSIKYLKCLIKSYLQLKYLCRSRRFKVVKKIEEDKLKNFQLNKFLQLFSVAYLIEETK